jgi:hypothetical protein
VICVERVFQLGGASSFEVADSAGFVRAVLSDRRAQRTGGDCQGLQYEVETEADALALGAEDTVGGWYHRDLDLVINVGEVES